MSEPPPTAFNATAKPRAESPLTIPTAPGQPAFANASSPPRVNRINVLARASHFSGQKSMFRARTGPVAVGNAIVEQANIPTTNS